MQESILEEIASEDRTLQGGSHDQDVPDVDGQLWCGLHSSAMQKPIPFDGKVSWDFYKTQFEMLYYMNQWKEPEKVAYLAISLRGPAVGVLSNLTPEQRLDYKALSTALDI